VAFGPIQRAVGCIQHVAEILAELHFGDAGADGGKDLSRAHLASGLGKGVARAFCDRVCGGESGARQNDGELLAAVTAKEIVRPENAADCVGECSQDSVSDRVYR